MEKRTTISFSAEGFYPNSWNVSQSQTKGLPNYNPFEINLDEVDNSNPWERIGGGGGEVDYSGFGFTNGDSSLKINEGFSGNFGESPFEDGKQQREG